MPPKQNRNIEKLAEAFSECQITSCNETSASGTIITNINDPVLCSKWAKVKIKVPDVFLHKPTNFAIHVQKLLSMGIKFYQPYLSRYYTKITCPTFDDQKALTQYFEKKQLPYHTFGHPSKRKMKVVIKGLPQNIDLNILKSELRTVSIPIIRVHEMRKQENLKHKKPLILAVVPYNDEGKKLLRVKKILGYNIKMEPPKSKTKQCHRCQMWGHTQRYCHGKVKCVKYAGEHLSKKCERDANKEPPKCANCGGDHTASFRDCPCCPDSWEHQYSQLKKQSRVRVLYGEPDLVTKENCDKLYKNTHINPN